MFSKTGFSCWLLAVTAVAVAALLVWPAVALSSIPTERTATVSLGVSARGSVQKTLLLAGTTAYADERFAISPQSGIAVWVTSKQEGQSVARGEALLRLDVTAQENLLTACYAKPSEKSLSSELLLAAGGQPRLSADQLKESISQSTVRAHEAGQVLGMSKWQVFRHVVLLQVVKRVIPPMSNEIITLVKDTALASVIVHVDLFTIAKQIVNAEVILWPLFYAGVFYLIFNGILTLLLGKLEKKLSYYKV